MSLFPYLLKQDNNRPYTEGSDERIKQKGHWLALVTTSRVGLVVVSNVLKHFLTPQLSLPPVPVTSSMSSLSPPPPPLPPSSHPRQNLP